MTCHHTLPRAPQETKSETARLESAHAAALDRQQTDAELKRQQLESEHSAALHRLQLELDATTARLAQAKTDMQTDRYGVVLLCFDVDIVFPPRDLI